jgi:transcriptional regulator GlxA family with amidase domain
MIMAHEMLCRADFSFTTVTEIAMFFGFEELGRFSVRYRQMFGRRPSLTLDERLPTQPNGAH